MYEYFVSYRYYDAIGYGFANINIELKNKIVKAADVQILRDIIQNQYPKYDIIIILFFKEFFNEI